MFCLFYFQHSPEYYPTQCLVLFQLNSDINFLIKFLTPQLCPAKLVLILVLFFPNSSLHREKKRPHSNRVFWGLLGFHMIELHRIFQLHFSPYPVPLFKSIKDLNSFVDIYALVCLHCFPLSLSIIVFDIFHIHFMCIPHNKR